MLEIRKHDANADGQAASFDIWQEADIMREVAYARAVNQLRKKRLLHQRWMIVSAFLLCFGMGIVVGANSSLALPVGYTWPAFFSTVLSDVPGILEVKSPDVVPALASDSAATAAQQLPIEGAAPEASATTVTEVSSTTQESNFPLAENNPTEATLLQMNQRSQGAPANTTESPAGKLGRPTQTNSQDNDRLVKLRSTNSEKAPIPSQKSPNTHSRTVRDQPPSESLISPLVIIEQ